MRLKRPSHLTQLECAPLEESPLLPARALPLSHVRLEVECASLDALFAAVAQVIAGSERRRPEQVVQRLWSRHQRSSPALVPGPGAAPCSSAGDSYTRGRLSAFAHAVTTAER